MTFPILASLLVSLVVLLPFHLLRFSLATPSRWTPLALYVFLPCVAALPLPLLSTFLLFTRLLVRVMVSRGGRAGGMALTPVLPGLSTLLHLVTMTMF